ncbi:coiled-coil domain-containing protein 134-like [Actinia tenebrosa]|uniref:Coiled-coil domain-containing protein 134-like n=1 Tax=Actinia tenebrosa TaxID=6105 RepID=A0A6P8H0E6_ACTTE|nr:coiled-coil domain-containing protein 134-like [Actinia tenebrosa]
MNQILQKYLIIFLFSISHANEKIDKIEDELREEQRLLRENQARLQLETYRRGFKVKRGYQVAASKSMQLEVKGYAKQYEMTDKVLEKMFMVLKDSKTALIESGYTPGDPFPTDKKIQEALAHVLENTAFFGDILLRLPDITHQIYSKSKENQLIMKWCISICNASEVYDKTGHQLLDLIAQELELIPKDENYINPYKESTMLEKEFAKQKAEGKGHTPQQKKKEKKKKKKRGPKLSDEL